MEAEFVFSVVGGIIIRYLRVIATNFAPRGNLIVALVAPTSGIQIQHHGEAAKGVNLGDEDSAQPMPGDGALLP